MTTDINLRHCLTNFFLSCETFNLNSVRKIKTHFTSIMCVLSTKRDVNKIITKNKTEREMPKTWLSTYRFVLVWRNKTVRIVFFKLCRIPLHYRFFIVQCTWCMTIGKKRLIITFNTYCLHLGIFNFGCRHIINIPTYCVLIIILKSSIAKYFSSARIWDYVWAINLKETKLIES
jgi:hypothetical protein